MRDLNFIVIESSNPEELKRLVSALLNRHGPRVLLRVLRDAIDDKTAESNDDGWEEQVLNDHLVLVSGAISQSLVAISEKSSK